MKKQLYSLDKAKYPFVNKENSLEIMAPIADRVIKMKKEIDGEEKIVIEADTNVNINERISSAILDEANKQEKFDKYEKMVYLLKELKGYCVTEKELAKVEKTILKVKKKQAKYYQPTLLNSNDYKNFIKKCSR